MLFDNSFKTCHELRYHKKERIKLLSADLNCFREKFIWTRAGDTYEVW